MADGRELTAEDCWEELLAQSDAGVALGVWNRYVVSTDGDRVVAERRPGHCLRAIKGLSRRQDEGAISQTSVFENPSEAGAPEGPSPGGFNGSVRKEWTLRREDCGPHGLVNTVVRDSCRSRLIVRRSFGQDGPVLSFFSGLELPGPGLDARPEGFFGEVDLADEGLVVGVTFVYSRDIEKNAYVLSDCGEIQERRGRDDLLTVDVDFDALEFSSVSARLPEDPGDWMPGGGWVGRSSRLELYDKGMRVSECRAAWTPPDVSDSSMALLLLDGEAYFWGPRMLPGEKSDNDVGVSEKAVFEAGKRMSGGRFQRVVWKYEAGSCVRIDHELYNEGEP